MDSKRLYWILLLTFGGVFYVMNYFTPMLGDDYAYCFYFDNHSILERPTPERVTSFGMVLESMWNHYQIVNGRFVSHVFVQGFCALWGKTLFNIVNTVVFMVFLHVLVLLSKHNNSVFVLAIAFLVSMCLLPYPGQTMLWMTGAINYLWPTTLALWYIYWLQNYIPQQEKVWKHLLCGLMCVAIAWTNESISAPIAFGLFVYFIANRNDFKGLNVSTFIGYAIGASLIIFSPGTFVRLGNDEEVFQPLAMDQFIFIHSYNTLYNFVHLIFPLLVFCIFVYKFCKDYMKRPLNIFNSLYGCLFFAFLLFLWVLGMIDERIYFGVSVLSFVIILRWSDSFISKVKANKFVVVVACVLCVVPSIYALNATHKYYIADNDAKTIVNAAPSKCIIQVPEVPESSRYCYYLGMESLSPDRYQYHNRVKAFYFDKTYIQALPNDVYTAWKNGTLSQLTAENVLILSPEQVVKHKAYARYMYPDNSEILLPRQKLIRRLFNTLATESVEQVYYVEHGDSCYLIFPKIDDALKIEVPMIVEGEEVMIEYNDFSKVQ